MRFVIKLGAELDNLGSLRVEADGAARVARVNPNEQDGLGSFIDDVPSGTSSSPSTAWDSSSVGAQIGWALPYILTLADRFGELKGQDVSFDWDSLSPDVWVVRFPSPAGAQVLVRQRFNDLFAAGPSSLVGRSSLVIEPADGVLLTLQEMPAGLLVDGEDSPGLTGEILVSSARRRMTRSTDRASFVLSVWLHFTQRVAERHFDSIRQNVPSLEGAHFRPISASGIGDESIDFFEDRPNAGGKASYIVARAGNVIVTGVSVSPAGTDTRATHDLVARQIEKVKTKRRPLVPAAP